MEMRTLGRTGRSVGVIGFAGRALITHAHGLLPRDVQAVLYRALDLGVSVIDTPAGAEALVGEVVREQRARERAVVTIEVASGPPRAMTARVEAALRESRLEVMPLAVLRGDLDFAHPAMEQLVREGKVLHWGLRIDGDDEVPDDPLLAVAQVDALERTPDAVARGLGVIVHATAETLARALAQPIACAVLELRRPEDLERL